MAASCGEQKRVGPTEGSGGFCGFVRGAVIPHAWCSPNWRGRSGSARTRVMRRRAAVESPRRAGESSGRTAISCVEQKGVVVVAWWPMTSSRSSWTYLALTPSASSSSRTLASTPDPAAIRSISPRTHSDVLVMPATMASAGVLNAFSSCRVEVAAAPHGARACLTRPRRAASPRAWAFRVLPRKVRRPQRKRARWRRRRRAGGRGRQPRERERPGRWARPARSFSG